MSDVHVSNVIDPRNHCYTAEMIQEHFLRAIETGLRKEAVMAKLMLYLQTYNVEGDELIAPLTLCAEESERKSKLDKHKFKMAA